MDMLRTGPVIGKICELSGRNISETPLLNILHDLYPDHSAGTSWFLNVGIVRLVADYWAEWGGKKFRPLPSLWAKEHNLAIPPLSISAALIKKSETKKIAQKESIDERRIEKIIEKKVEGLRAEIESLRAALPAKQIEAPRGRENDPRIFKIHKRINSFVFSEPVRIDDVWNFLRVRFETRNSVKVLLVGAQTFPQWLLSEDWIDTFVQEYEGFLDELHDRLGKQGRLAL